MIVISNCSRIEVDHRHLIRVGYSCTLKEMQLSINYGRKSNALAYQTTSDLVSSNSGIDNAVYDISTISATVSPLCQGGAIHTTVHSGNTKHELSRIRHRYGVLEKTFTYV